MSRTCFILILLVTVLAGSLPGNSLAASIADITGPMEGALKVQEGKRKRRLEIRQQRTDAQAEVLFWFRTHPTERVFPQQEVDRMLKRGGYFPVVVEGLVGSHNPFFTEVCP
ncbi:MAG: hypothetical protein OXF47_04450 [Nitrospira sp.]|nr:hypothetical protein [Nitrospira sp.]